MQGATSERRATGRKGGVLKYDILTALGTHACAGDKHLQRLALRFITLIVARYNWQSDELSVGQREIAALWAVDERSVKREFAKLRSLGWLELRRPSTRGRVAVYGLGLAAILKDTRKDWDRVGTDFTARLGQDKAPAPAPPSNVISFPAPVGDGGIWTRIQTVLHRDDPALYAAWFAALRPEPQADGRLILVAPTRFHASYLRANHLVRLNQIARALDPAVAQVEIVTAG